MTNISYQKIQKVADRIVQDYKPEKIILFGSHAWGKPSRDSDVDLFVVKNSRKRRFDREYELRMKLFGHGFPPLDLLIYTPGEVQKRLEIEDFFVQDILSKGKILYER